MRIRYAKGTQRQLSEHRQPEHVIAGFLKKVGEAEWQTPHDALASMGGVDNLGHGVLCFNILGNRFRLLAQVNYSAGLFTVLFFGTHADYERFTRRAGF